jgi:hypothetical protein
MLSLTNVVYFLADKFARLRRGSFSLAPIAPRPFHGFFLWHNNDIQGLAD